MIPIRVLEFLLSNREVKINLDECVHCLSSLWTTTRKWSLRHGPNEIWHFLYFTNLKIQDLLFDTSRIKHFIWNLFSYILWGMIRLLDRYNHYRDCLIEIIWDSTEHCLILGVVLTYWLWHLDLASITTLLSLQMKTLPHIIVIIKTI